MLKVDLSKRTSKVFMVDEGTQKRFIGGAGLAAHLYSEWIKDIVDPLAPESPFIAMTGPLTGTSAALSGRHGFAGRSPLTGFWGHASVGGHWGEGLRHAGFDGLIIIGRADRPTYLHLENGKIQFNDATHLWGLDTFETDAALKNQLGEKVQISCIGPAGENLVRFAGIFSDGAHARTAARCGLGALMGSKNLKAITVRGNQPLPVKHPDLLKKSVKKILPDLAEKMKSLSQFGTPGLVGPCEAIGDLPIKNWSMGRWHEGAKKIGAQALNATYLKKRYHCAGCVVGCGRIIGGAFDNSPEEVGGPEYETLALLGSNCLIDDLAAIIRMNELVNRLGMDSIETGAVIAFCMELYEKGIIGEKELGPIDLKWGNGKAAEALIKLIANREKLGAVLAEGMKSAAENIGGMAIEYAIQSNNMALPGHDPRAYSSIALGYATSSRGPCHVDAFSHIFERAATFPDVGIDNVLDRFEHTGKAKMVIASQRVMHLWENLALCKFNIFGGVRLNEISEWLSLVLGYDMPAKDLIQIADRSFTLKRIMNIKWGWSGKNDTLPRRVITHRTSDGGAGDHLPPLNIMLADYYKERGWNNEGIPEENTLKQLGLSQE